MSEKNKVETKKASNILVNMLAGIVVAVIATAASYNYWHDTNVRLSFNIDSEKDINFQAFYLDVKGQNFNESKSVHKLIKSGNHNVEIFLPVKKMVRIRLDIGSEPGKVKLSDLVLTGNEKINLAYNEFFKNQIDDYEINEDGFILSSNQKDPYIFYRKEFDLSGKEQISWLRMGLIAGGSFIVAFLLAMLINRKKK